MSHGNYRTMSRSRVFAAYLGDIRFELVKMARTPAFAVPTLFFPAMFYVLFGVIMGSGQRSGTQCAAGARALGVFGTMAPGLFGFGVSLAFEREQGLLTFKQALPMPPGSYLLARMVMAMLFVGISSLLLITLARVHRPRAGDASARPCTLFCRRRARRAAVLRHRPVRRIAGLRPGGAGHHQPHLSTDGLPVGPVGAAAVPAQDAAGRSRRCGPRIIWRSSRCAPWARPTVRHRRAITSPRWLASRCCSSSLAMRRLGSRGISLFGRRARPARGFATAARAQHGHDRGSSIGLVIAGVMGGTAPHAAASTAATSKDATDKEPDPLQRMPASAAPVGVAAPDIAVIADFDDGSDQGQLWHRLARPSTTSRAAAIRRLPAAGRGRRAELAGRRSRSSGEVGTAIQYPFVGTSFLPNGKPTPTSRKQGFMDYSAQAHAALLRARRRPRLHGA